MVQRTMAAKAGIGGRGRGGERVAGDLFGQQRVAGGEWAEGGAGGGQAGEIAGERGAVAGDEGGFHLALFLEGKGNKLQVLLREPGASGSFDLGFGEEADFLATEFAWRG